MRSNDGTKIAGSVPSQRLDFAINLLVLVPPSDIIPILNSDTVSISTPELFSFARLRSQKSSEGLGSRMKRL